MTDDANSALREAMELAIERARLAGRKDLELVGLQAALRFVQAREAKAPKPPAARPLGSGTWQAACHNDKCQWTQRLPTEGDAVQVGRAHILGPDASVQYRSAKLCLVTVQLVEASTPGRVVDEHRYTAWELEWLLNG